MTAQFTTSEVNDSNAEIVVAEPSTPSEISVTESSNTSSSSETWRKVLETATDIIAELPTYLGQFFNRYRSLIVLFGWLFVALLSVKFLGAVLATLNGLPLTASLFELIGLGYTAWFVNRYLLTAGKRQELSQQFNQFKEQILG